MKPAPNNDGQIAGLASTASMVDPRSLRVLMCFPPAESVYRDCLAMEQAAAAHLRHAGFRVEQFVLRIQGAPFVLSWPELDRRWKRGDLALLEMYEQLESVARNCDVLINETGANLHPDFVQQLPIFTVFQCFDDPENSHNLSTPAAWAYDLCLVGNIAEVGAYRTWGVRQAHWTTMPLYPGSFDPTITEHDILEGSRDIEMFLMADRQAPWRRRRIEKLARAFPDGHFYGRGWDRGFLPEQDQLHFLRRAKIGPNIHNSTGPINQRFMQLPGNGVLQICDNKQHLSQLFDLGKEIVGFDTISECIELCRYYLAHDRERREIAAAGWRRAHRDYSLEAVHRRKLNMVLTAMLKPKPSRADELPSIAAVYRMQSQTQRKLVETMKPFLRIWDWITGKWHALANVYRTQIRPRFTQAS